MTNRANHDEPMNEPDGFTHIGPILSGVLKDLCSLGDLRLRLEAEKGRPVDDDDFFAAAKRMGITIL
jgi:hypothetical protein